MIPGGLVMWILLGWQSVLADYVAGLVLIGLLALTFRFIVPDGWFEAARDHLQSVEGVIRSDTSNFDTVSRSDGFGRCS